jgi:hypothetical protein
MVGPAVVGYWGWVSGLYDAWRCRVTLDDRPTPDPTILTTEQLLREISRLERLMESQVTGLRDLIEEKFVSVATQFALIERQRVEQKKDTKDAVDAALAAAKEAVKEQTTASDRSITKSETATSEQLKQLSTTFTTATTGITDNISDVKERVSRIETLKQGTTQNWGLLVGAVSLVALVITTFWNLSGR